MGRLLILVLLAAATPVQGDEAWEKQLRNLLWRQRMKARQPLDEAAAKLARSVPGVDAEDARNHLELIVTYERYRDKRIYLRADRSMPKPRTWTSNLPAVRLPEFVTIPDIDRIIATYEEFKKNNAVTQVESTDATSRIDKLKELRTAQIAQLDPIIIRDRARGDFVLNMELFQPDDGFVRLENEARASMAKLSVDGAPKGFAAQYATYNRMRTREEQLGFRDTFLRELREAAPPAGPGDYAVALVRVRVERTGGLIGVPPGGQTTLTHQDHFWLKSGLRADLEKWLAANARTGTFDWRRGGSAGELLERGRFARVIWRVGLTEAAAKEYRGTVRQALIRSYGDEGNLGYAGPLAGFRHPFVRPKTAGEE